MMQICMECGTADAPAILHTSPVPTGMTSLPVTWTSPIFTAVQQILSWPFLSRMSTQRFNNTIQKKES